MATDVKTKSTAGLLIIIVLAILIVINLISLNLFSRVDLTDNEIYSLSESSIALVEDLADRLTVKVYFTDDLPAPHNNDARYLKDLLDDYKAYSGGMLQYEFIDPVKADKEQEAQSYRIPPLQFNVFRNNKTEFIKGYKGLVLMYGDQVEVIPFIENTINLEYDLSRAVNKLTQTTIPTVAFTTGHGEPEAAGEMSWADQMLRQEYRVQYLNLADLKSIPEMVKALFVVAPKQPFSDWELYLIDQFIMRGGRAAFLMDKFDIDIQSSTVTPVNTGLDSLLEHYGVGLQENLVIDLQCNMVPVTRQMGQFRMQSIVNYPFYLDVVNFHEENPIVKTLTSFDMIYVSPLDISDSLGMETEVQILFSSSEQSGLRSLPVDISPEKKYQREDFDRKHLPLGAAVTGRLISYFTDRPLPVYTGTDTMAAATPEMLPFTEDARLVIVGNGSFITDEHRRNNTSFVVLLNTADWLTQSKGLISIRSKQVTQRTLETTSEGTKQLVKYINIFVMPAAVVLFGVIRWQIKRSRRKREMG